jgi:hypothetical protein
MGSSPFGERHEWAMRELCEMTTKKGDRIGSRAIKSITPRAADKITNQTGRNACFDDPFEQRRIVFVRQ